MPILSGFAERHHATTLLRQGGTIGHLAGSLSPSVKAVSTHRTRVVERMGLASNSDLTCYALKNGLIQ